MNRGGGHDVGGPRLGRALAIHGVATAMTTSTAATGQEESRCWIIIGEGLEGWSEATFEIDPER